MPQHTTPNHATATPESIQSQQQIPTRIIHLNHAGASPCSDTVHDCIVEHLQFERRVGGYHAEDMVRQQHKLQNVYQSIADLIHARDAHEIAMVESATVGWTRFFYAAAQYQWERYQCTSTSTMQVDSGIQRFILVSEADYAANIVAICHWCTTHNGWHVLRIPSVESIAMQCDICTTGKVNVQVLDDMIYGRYWYSNSSDEKLWLDPANIAMICIAHIPTNSGIVNPVEEIGTVIDTYNRSIASCGQPAIYDEQLPPQIIYFVDACQSAGQIDIDVNKIHCHGLAATGRKYLRGPRGTGFLYVSNTIAHHLYPTHVDHNSTPVIRVPMKQTLQQPLECHIKFEPQQGAKRFEFWESSIALKLGLGCAISEVIQIGLPTISNMIQQRALELYNSLQTISWKSNDQLLKLRLHHHPECGIVTFWIDGLEAKELKEDLWKSHNVRNDYTDEMDLVQFSVSVVPATSTPMDSSVTAIPDLIRVSVSYTTTKQDIGLFCTCIHHLLQKDSK
jgi:cysteine desulfurase / selenocysteine lyase